MKRKSILYVAVTLLTLTATLTFAATPVWTAKLHESAKWQTVTEIGTLLVGTEGSLCSFDSENGNSLWTRDDLKKTAQFNVRELPGTPVLLVNNHSGQMNPKTKILALDIATGKTLWETPEEQGYPIGIFPVLAKNLVLVFANAWQKEGGAGIYMSALEIETGKKLWETKYAKPSDVPLHPADNSGRFFVTLDLSGHQEPVVQGDLLYLSFAGVHCFDLNTGTKKWGTEFRTVPKQGWKRASAGLLFDDTTVFVSAVNNVRAFDKTSGALKWEGKKVWSGTIVEMQDAGDKLIVRLGGNFLEPSSRKWALEKPLEVLALEKATGNEVWRYKDIDDGITNLQLDKEHGVVLVADSGALVGLDLNSSGTAKEKFKVKLEFKRKLGGGEAAMKFGLGALGGISGIVKAAGSKDRLDIPVAITKQPAGYVVRGKQHLLAFDPGSQQIKWSTYYAAPGSSGFEMVMMTALTASVALSYNASYAAGQSSLDSASRNVHSSLDQFNKFADKRYSATKAARQNVYILTQVEEGKDKGVGLMAIDLNTGEPVGQVLLKEKDPDYAVDDVTGRLYYVKNKKEIQALDVK